jgi:hypothetical protein
MADFHGLPTAVLDNGPLRLEYLAAAGPRLVGLSYHGSPNLLADMFDLTTDTPLGKYSFLGGHRLWISPESITKTYIPDQAGLEVEQLPDGVKLTGLSEPVSGVCKSLLVRLEGNRPAIRITHIIVNDNPSPIMLAPWALTMLIQGGTAILPQPAGNSDPDGLLPNRLLELWPYTRIHDPRLVLRDDFILLHAAPSLPPVKLGYASSAGWLAYWREGLLFRKSFDLRPGAAYPDGGCNAETYCGDRFIELETLGPLVTLAPGQLVEHTETWELFDSLDVPSIPEEIRELLKKIVGG